MPDLITHTVAAYMVRKRKISVHSLIIYLIGSILPDILTRPFMIMFPFSKSFFHAFHTPVALVFFIILICYQFAEEMRVRIFVLLSLGTATHLFLDMFQTSVNTRGYSWLFPFSYSDFRIPLFWSEDSVMFIPLIVVIFAVDFWISYIKKREISK